METEEHGLLQLRDKGEWQALPWDGFISRSLSLAFPFCSPFSFFSTPLLSHFPLFFLIFSSLTSPSFSFFLKLHLLPLPYSSPSHYLGFLRDQALLGKIQNWDQHRKKEKEIMFSTRTREEEHNIKAERQHLYWVARTSLFLGADLMLWGGWSLGYGDTSLFQPYTCFLLSCAPAFIPFSSWSYS